MKENNQMLKKMIMIFVIALTPFLWIKSINADSLVKKSKGQTLYVPVYSHVHCGDRALPFNLAVTLSIRNTDPQHTITVTTANYYDSRDVLVKAYLTQNLLK